MEVPTQEGRCEGRKPYGFYGQEDKVIERMKALRAEGLGHNRIAVQMNAEGLKTRTRGRWHSVMVSRILNVQNTKERRK
jgi:site-specific DNA recombinase